MYFPQFLVGMSATLLAVLGWTYATTGLLWQALGWTFLAAVLLQVSYFVAVLVLVHRRALRETKTDATLPPKLTGPFERDGIIHMLLLRLF